MHHSLNEHWTNVRERLCSFYAAHTGYIVMSTGATMNSIMITFMKLLVDSHGIPTTTVIFVRMVCTIILTAVCLLSNSTKEAYFGAPGVRLWLLARGIVGILSFWLIYHCLKYLPMEDQQAIWFTAPILTGIIAFLWLGESFGLSEWLAGLVSLLGVILVVQPSFIFDSAENSSAAALAQGFAEAIVGTVFGALALVIVRHMGRKADVLTSLLWFGFIASSVMGLIMLVDKSRRIDFNQITLSSAALLAGVALSGTLATFCMNKGVQVENSGRVSLVMYIQLPFVVLLDWLVFGNVIGLLTLVGCIIIVSAAIFVALSQSAKTKTQPALPLEERPSQSVYVQIADDQDGDSNEVEKREIQVEAPVRRTTQERALEKLLPSAIPPKSRLSFVHHRSNSKAWRENYHAVPEMAE